MTHGGDPHAACRIGRHLQRTYDRVTVLVPGPCLSAGTLLSISAHELAISEFGLLGPLDIQLQKADELFERTSVLAVAEAMDAVRYDAVGMLRDTLSGLKALGSQIALKTAMDAAVSLTAGVFLPVSAQIDPIRLGEDGRSARIIEGYGRRLDDHAGNPRRDALRNLVSRYPSHRLSIDREEATETLFRNVRGRKYDEAELARLLPSEPLGPLSAPSVRSHGPSGDGR